METNPSPRRSPTRYSLILVLLLTLIGILSGCGASSTAEPSHPTVPTPTSTPTQELKGTISEFPLPTPNLYAGGITMGPDSNLWFSESDIKNQNYKIGRITPAGAISEFPLPRPGIVPGNITVGPGGKIWFTEMNSSKIGRLV